MKVTVHCIRNRVTKTEMEREIEKLFQENKDLRVRCSHLQDTIDAKEKGTVVRDGAIAALTEMLTTAQEQVKAAETEAGDLRLELMDREERISILEYRLKYIEEQRDEYCKEYHQIDDANTSLVQENDELRDERDELQKTVDCLSERIADMTVALSRSNSKNQDLMAQMQTLEEDRDEWRASVTLEQNEHEATRERLRELEIDYDELLQLKRSYGEEIDRLRKVVTELQTNRFTMEEVFKMAVRQLKEMENEIDEFESRHPAK